MNSPGVLDERPARFSRIIQSWDTANKAAELNDYSVATTWGIDGKCFYLLDVYRRRLNYPDLKRAIEEQAQRHRASTILIEDKASGTQLIQDFSGRLWGITPYVPPPNTDKVMRRPDGVFENGFVLLPRTADWLSDYVKEITSFPGSRYDDQVDSTTQALDYLRSTIGSLEVWIRLARG